MKIIDENLLGYYGTMFTRLYTDVANQDPNIGTVEFEGYPKELNDYIKTVYPTETVVFKNEINDKKFFEVEENNKVLMGFSGGKDSTAVVLKLKKAGYEPILFFAKGVNRAYPNEIDSAVKLAELLKCEIIIHEAKYSGKMFYGENPIKNQYILALMLDYGLSMGISKYCMGDCGADSLNEANRHFNWSDSQEMFIEFEKFVKVSFPQYEKLNLIQGERDSYEEIIAEGMQHLFPSILSCVLPYRYRRMRKEGNEKKFGIKLMENRCGSCVKCCLDYIYFYQHEVERYNEKFYDHCINKLREKTLEVYGFKGNKLTDEELFRLYGIID